jgi:dipeptidyl-peptidase-4
MRRSPLPFRLPFVPFSLGALTVFVALLALVALPSPGAAAPARVSFDDLFATGAGGRQPGNLEWEAGSGRLLYTWDEKGDGSEKAWYRLDPATGRRETLLRLADLKKMGKPGKGSEAGSKKDLVPDAILPSPKHDAFLLVADGDLYLYGIPGQSVRTLTETPGAEQAASFSPDGSKVAFVRGWNLHVLDLESGEERALTRDGEENAILNGINDWVYEEEIWNRAPAAYWWSPDGSRIAYLHFDEEGVGLYPIVDSAPLYPSVQWQKYPKAGETNPKVTVGVVEVATGVTSWLPTEPAPKGDHYIARVAWAPKGDAVAVQRLNREQTKLELLRCPVDPRKGTSSGDCAPLVTETQATWINIENDFRYLPDGRFVWGSEREGWRRLYLHAADGSEIRPLTPKNWSIRALDAVGDDGASILVTGFEGRGLEPIHKKVARVGLAKEGWEVLTPERGTHRAVADPKTGSYVHMWSTADAAPAIELRRSGKAPLPLPSAPPATDLETLPKWEFVLIDGPDGPGGIKLPARILKPSPFDPSAKYPVLMYHYGGPASQVVDDGWNLRSHYQKAMAQRGFVLFSVDNASSLFFGKTGEDRDHRRFGEVNLAGQLAGVAYLKTLPWVDAKRIGLWGWSGGGTNTLYCILSRPGVWKAAVSGAPVTDWRLYDSIWTERYLDSPQDNAEGYKDSSPITHAAKLADHLLLIHGFADDNVHPQNSVNFSDALIKAGRPFEEAFYPKQKHGFGPAYSRHYYEKMTEFFERTLQGVEIEDVGVVEGK